MKCCVFGLWHLGCITAACLSEMGHNIIGLDLDEKNIRNLNNCESPIYEPGLNELIKKGIERKSLSFTFDPVIALKDVDFLWITFDTPVDTNDNADIDFVYNQIKLILPDIRKNTKIIISSQLPVGFTKKLEDLFIKNIPEKKCIFAYSPENLRLGKAINVFKNPDRIIIGVRNKEDKNKFENIFLPITEKLIWMKTESAEMTKHAINSFLATSITFANEIASICETVGADAMEVSKGLKSEERIGPKSYLNPGLSYAGGTLARDINFLIDLSIKNNKKSFLLKSVKKSNQDHKNWIKQKCCENFNNIKNKKFALLGLTYKANTDTLRRSSAVELAKWINKSGGIVFAFDPLVKNIPENLSKIIVLENDIKKIIKDVDCVIISTEHSIFLDIFENLGNILKNKIIIDPTSLIEKKIENINNLKYISVGRG